MLDSPPGSAVRFNVQHPSSALHILSSPGRDMWFEQVQELCARIANDPLQTLLGSQPGFWLVPLMARQPAPRFVTWLNSPTGWTHQPVALELSQDCGSLPSWEELSSFSRRGDSIITWACRTLLEQWLIVIPATYRAGWGVW